MSDIIVAFSPSPDWYPNYWACMAFFASGLVFCVVFPIALFRWMEIGK